MYRRGLGHERFVTHKVISIVCSKGVMEVGNGGRVPGAAGRGACEETALIIDEMDDYHFNDLLGKPGDRERAYRGNLWRSTTRTHSSDSG
jgi:hypothetical protein